MILYQDVHCKDLEGHILQSFSYTVSFLFKQLADALIQSNNLVLRGEKCLIVITLIRLKYVVS